MISHLIESEFSFIPYTVDLHFNLIRHLLPNLTNYCITLHRWTGE